MFSCRDVCYMMLCGILGRVITRTGIAVKNYITTLDIRVHQWTTHDDVIKWKHFPRYWPFVLGLHRWQVNSPHKGQWRGALMFSLICARINAWVNNSKAGDLRRNHAHYDVTVMTFYGRSNFLNNKCVIKSETLEHIVTPGAIKKIIICLMCLEWRFIGRIGWILNPTETT